MHATVTPYSVWESNQFQFDAEAFTLSLSIPVCWGQGFQLFHLAMMGVFIPHR